MSGYYSMLCLSKQKEILESKGYTVAYIAVQGSQNYELDLNIDKHVSDIDMKAMVVPSLREIVYNQNPVSTVVETEWGQCEIKDIREYFKNLLKANPTYIETIFTDYYIVDDCAKEEFKVKVQAHDVVYKQILKEARGEDNE